SNAPGRVEHAAAGKSTEQGTIEVKSIDEALSGPGNFVFRIRVLLRKHHIQRAADILHIERRIAGRQVRITEIAGQCLGGKLRIEYVNMSRVKIGRIEQVLAAIVADGHALVDRASNLRRDLGGGGRRWR